MDNETYNMISAILGILQIIAIFFAGWGIFQQSYQIKKINEQVDLQTHQVKLQADRVFISSISIFTQLYQSIMTDLPKADAGQSEIKSWWYRYWDVHIAEVTFCTRGYLDPIIYELWLLELVRNFDSYPHGAVHMETFSKSMDAHISRVVSQHTGIRVFFDELKEISMEKNENQQAKKVRELVEKTFKSVDNLK